MIQTIQDAADLSLGFHFPDVGVPALCLKTYCIEKASGRKPISIPFRRRIVSYLSELLELLELVSVRPFKVVLMASKRMKNGFCRR